MEQFFFLFFVFVFSSASLKIVVVFTRAPSEQQTIQVRVSHPASHEQTLDLQQDESGAQTLNNVAAGTHTIEALTSLKNHDVSITCVDGAGASTTTEGMSASIQLSNTDQGTCTINYSRKCCVLVLFINLDYNSQLSFIQRT